MCSIKENIFSTLVVVVHCNVPSVLCHIDKKPKPKCVPTYFQRFDAECRADFFFSEHDVLLKIKVPAFCYLWNCLLYSLCYLDSMCKKDIENEIANILETKGFSTRNRAVLLKHR